MSVSNIILAADRAVLVTDTMVYNAREPAALARKVVVRPEARFAMTCRGRTWIAAVLADLSARWRSFEDACDAIGDELAGLPRQGERHGKALGDGFEVAVIGWQDGPRAVRLTWRDGLDVIERRDLGLGADLAPSLGRQAIPADLTDDQIVRIAVLQQDIARRHRLAMCIGGQIEVTTATEHGVETRVLGDYPDRAETEARIAGMVETVAA